MAKPRRMSVVDRTGERHGRLLVLFRAENKIEPSGAVRAQWRCKCDCGNGTTVSGHALSREHTRSCGCMMREKEGKHGKSYDPIYRVWNNIRQRCRNPKHSAFGRYGGRGINICDEWHNDFAAFYRDMGDPPKPDMSIDRIDNDKNYEPGNCRWATRLQQGNNRGGNVHLTFNGLTLTQSEWSRVTGLAKTTIRNRVNAGWTDERVLTEPLKIAGQGRGKG